MRIHPCTGTDTQHGDADAGYKAYNGPMSSESETAHAERTRLRNETRAARAALDERVRAYKSSELCERLGEALMLTLGITGTAAEHAVVGVYAAFPEEVDLTEFIERAYAQGCSVAFPCMMEDARSLPDAPGRPALARKGDASAPDGRHITRQTMEMRVVDADAFRSGTVPFLAHPLKRHRHADAALAAFPYVPADELAMLVVPMVGFDAQGNRLGYGAGNYDRYLAQVPHACRVVGVAFAEQEVASIPVEAHDVPLPVISL